ncbi:MAG: YkgJ family cysteine cluster protein [Candidatus Thiodiazotropha sp.]
MSLFAIFTIPSPHSHRSKTLTVQEPQAETLETELRIGNHSIRFSAQFSTEKVGLHELLPLFQNITDKVVDIAATEASEQGERISCRSGCSACCSQLVPVSKAEAVSLLKLIESMPGARRSEIEARFEKNMVVLEEAGLLEALEHAALDHDKERLRAIGLDYFRLDLPCPFLQDHSCSIHPHRPLSCREFLVVSDPLYCADLDPGHVKNVALPKTVSPIIYEMCSGDRSRDRGFIPLVRLLADAESLLAGQPDPAPAVAWVRRFFKRLCG